MDFSFIGDFFNGVNAFAQDIWNYLYIGLYDLIKAVMVTLTKAMIYAYFQSLIMCIDIAHEAVDQLLQETGVMDQVTDAWNIIPADTRSTLSFFNVPQGLGLIFTAIPTRWAMKFVPLIGR